MISMAVERPAAAAEYCLRDAVELAVDPMTRRPAAVWEIGAIHEIKANCQSSKIKTPSPLTKMQNVLVGWLVPRGREYFQQGFQYFSRSAPWYKWPGKPPLDRMQFSNHNFASYLSILGFCVTSAFKTSKNRRCRF